MVTGKSEHSGKYIAEENQHFERTSLLFSISEEKFISEMKIMNI